MFRPKSCSLLWQQWGKCEFLDTKKENSLRDLVWRAHLEPILECLKNHMDSFRRDLPLELPTVRHFQELQNHGMTLGQ